MNQLTTYNQNLPTAPPEDYTAFLPSWINYLVAAYPQARPAARTYAVLEDQFNGIDEGLMNRAVRRHVAKSEWWPTAADLWPLVRELQSEPGPLTEADQYQLALARAKANRRFSDEEIHAWEVARGGYQ